MPHALSNGDPFPNIPARPLGKEADFPPSAIPIYYFREAAKGQVILSPGLFELLFFPLPSDSRLGKPALRSGRVSIRHWEMALEHLTKRPVAGFPHVYQLEDDNAPSYVRLHRPVFPGQAGALVDVTAETAEALRLRRRLEYDPLTSLYSRPAFKRRVFDMIAEAPDKVGAMLFADLDDLKRINDTHGHSAGDLYISRMARFFSLFSFYNGAVARISGDEFAVYLHGFEDQAAARRVVHRILAAKSATLPSFSIGLSWYPADSDNMSELMKLADFAMYAAKRQKKGGFSEFGHAPGTETSCRQERREALLQALSPSSLSFACQPIYENGSGRLFGYEAVLTPASPAFPTAFDLFSAAAECSRLGELERLLMEKFVAMAQEPPFDDGAFLLLSCLTGELCAKGADWQGVDKSLFSRLLFGVTEWTLGSPEEVARKAASLRRLGAQIAADAVGDNLTGELFPDLHPDVWQLDWALLRNLNDPAEERRILARLCAAASETGGRVLVRNVSSEDERAFLRQTPADYWQGPLSGPPMPL